MILDQHMQEMTGPVLAERLRADGAGIPILLVTGSPSLVIVARAAEVGIAVGWPRPKASSLKGCQTGVLWTSTTELSPRATVGGR